MKKKGKRKIKLFPPGWSAGMKEYREGVIVHGATQIDVRARITLAGTKQPPKPIFRGDRRKHVVDSVMDAMRDWRSSPFQHEGPTVAAVRSALCLDGYGWPRSDAEASALVTSALTLLGAQRPTVEQGQPEYCESRDSCLRCGRPVDEFDQHTRGFKFCSSECAAAEVERRDFIRRSDADKIYAAARRTIRKSLTSPRQCEWPGCGRSFQPINDTSSQRFCCYSCAAKHRATLRPKVDRPVEAVPCARDGCGASFVPRRKGRPGTGFGKFCSEACSIADRSNRRYDLVCRCCGEPFVAATPKAQYCCLAHAKIVQLIAHGSPPARLSPPVFDYMIRTAA